MAALAIQTQAQTFLTNGLVAYYPFNGNANDASGNGNNLANHGATLCADRFGNPNQAYSFNGSSYLGSSTVPLSQIDNWTVVAWINLASLNQVEAYVVCMGYDDGGSGNGYALGVAGGNQLGAFFGGVGGFPGGYVFPSTNQWYQVVMLRSSGSTMFYVNGVLTTNGILNTPGTPTSFEIGSATGIRFFNGAIDDVRIYNRALSASEVQELYQYESVLKSYQATATAEVINGFVTGVTITYPGYGYTNTPTVTITGGGGSGAQAVAVVSNGFVVAIDVLDAGAGYTNTPLIVIDPPLYPYPATAAANVVNGFVVGATILYGGSRYTNTPTVKIIGGGGSGAQGVAVVSNGCVVAIDVLDAGSDYTNTPLVVIDPPFIPNPVLGVVERMSSLAFSNLTLGGVYQLQQFAGGYYWTNQPVNFTATNSVYTQVVSGTMDSGEYRLVLSPVPAQAFAVPEVVNGFVVGATVTSGGSGYVTNPTVSFVGGGGINAGAVSQISGGVVTSITITNAGIGYTNTPIVEIDPPPAIVVSPTIQMVMRMDSADLAPYDNYQIQFTPALGGAWRNWDGGLFSPTDVTNSQYLLVTNTTAFFRLQYVP
ncbi:MAG: LamG domain-containing protein [Verrucomicrobiota bacterium]